MKESVNEFTLDNKFVTGPSPTHKCFLLYIRNHPISQNVVETQTGSTD